MLSIFVCADNLLRFSQINSSMKQLCHLLEKAPVKNFQQKPLENTIKVLKFQNCSHTWSISLYDLIYVSLLWVLHIVIACLKNFYSYNLKSL